mgnify:CR=1 FL=1|jgi:hypothetical protein
MTRFIMLHRTVNGQTVPTWVNVENINTITPAITGPGSRITLKEGFLLAEDNVADVLEKIRRAEDER